MRPSYPRPLLYAVLMLVVPAGAHAQSRSSSGALDAIKEAEIRADLFKLAGDGGTCGACVSRRAAP